VGRQRKKKIADDGKRLQRRARKCPLQSTLIEVAQAEVKAKEPVETKKYCKEDEKYLTLLSEVLQKKKGKIGSGPRGGHLKAQEKTFSF